MVKLNAWVTFAASFASLVQANSPPVVSNITVSQRTDGLKLVDIRYDLADADRDACTVSVLASADGGATWTAPISALSGHVGTGITPGLGNHIIWNSTIDLPGAFDTNYRVRICADDGHAPEGMVPIPAGTFQMGDHHDGMSRALPVHTVTLDGFYLDRYEVTTQQYADALNWAWNQGGLITVIRGVVYKYNSGTSYPYCFRTVSSQYSRITWNGSSFGVVAGKENHPMVGVSWYGWAAYANWRSVMEGRTPSYDTLTWICNFAGNGYRLPTEAEWEYAARGGLDNPYRRYPWGDALDGSKANYWSSGDPYEPGTYPWTTPVGYYAQNGYGLYDMTGNVSEWVHDWLGDYPDGPTTNPTGPASGRYRSHRVLRGGSWYPYGRGLNLRCASRFSLRPGYRNGHHGFRLALD